MMDTQQPNWSHEGKDGKAELIINLGDSPEDDSSIVIRVSGRNRAAVAARLVALLNESKFVGA